jgi:two-component system sensor histidine kinase CpxA
MKLRLSLPAKIFLLAFLNVALLVAVFAIFVHVEFRFELGSFVLSPARERLFSVSRLIALELPQTPRSAWDQLLERHSSAAAAQLGLFDRTGEQMAGPPMTLPPQVASSVKREHLRGPGGGGRMRMRLFAPGGADRSPEPGAAPEPPDRAEVPPAGADLPSMRGEGPLPEGAAAAPGRPDEPAPGRPERARAPLAGLTFIRTGSPSRYWVGVPIPIWTTPGAPPTRATLVWSFPSLWTNPFFFDYKPWLAAIGAVILLSVLCWLPFIRGLTHSIAQLTRATGNIAEVRFDVQLSTKRRDEIGQLSRGIQTMAERLAGYVHGQKRFLGDIAHELCSPISRIQMALGILEQRAARNQREYVHDVQEDVAHMSDLVNELLSFSKAQINDANAPLAAVDIAEVVDRVLQREAPNVQVTTAIAPGLQALAHPDYLFRSLANLVRNSVRYAGDAGPITVSAVQDDERVRITVADNGPGLPEAELDAVFKPFYRPEFARQRETGGTGLGLAIVRSCVEACGGAAVCRNRTPHGLEVEISLAAAGAAAALLPEARAQA